MNNYSSIPIIELKKENGLWINTNFVPPSIFLYQDNPIIGECQKCVSYIISLLYESSSDNVKMCLIMQHVIYISAFLKQDKINTYELFSMMCRILSCAMACNYDNKLIDIPIYNYNDLYNTFIKTSNMLKEYIAQIKASINTRTFNVNGEIFSLNILNTDVLENKITVGLVPNNITTNIELIKWVDDVKIVSEKNTNILNQNRTIGAGRRFIREMPDRTVVVDIEIDKIYTEVGDNILIYNNFSKIQPARIILYEQ